MSYQHTVSNMQQARTLINTIADGLPVVIGLTGLRGAHARVRYESASRVWVAVYHADRSNSLHLIRIR